MSLLSTTTAYCIAHDLGEKQLRSCGHLLECRSDYDAHFGEAVNEHSKPDWLGRTQLACLRTDHLKDQTHEAVFLYCRAFSTLPLSAFDIAWRAASEQSALQKLQKCASGEANLVSIKRSQATSAPAKHFSMHKSTALPCTKHGYHGSKMNKETPPCSPVNLEGQ